MKRRKVEDKQAAVHRQQVVRNKGRVRKAPALESPLTGGFLARELGGCSSSGVSRSRGRPSDVVAGCFADGLVEKGCLPLGDARWGGGGMRRNVQHMYVDGQDHKTGVCTAFSSKSFLLKVCCFMANMLRLQRSTVTLWSRHMSRETEMGGQYSLFQ